MKRFSTKLLMSVVVVTVGVGLSAGNALAGGWAMSSLDAAPAPVAGRALDVGFTIRQHGVTPVNPDDGKVGIEVRTASGSEQFFPATAKGPRGHYVARVRIDTPGASSWKVHQGWFGPQDLGRIDVARNATGVGTSSGAGSGAAYRGSLSLRLLLPAVGLALGAFAVADALAARRRRSRDLIAT